MTDELLIKFLLSETEADENAMVQRWLIEDPANQAYYGQFKKIWETGKKLEQKSTVDEEEAWRKFKSRTTAPSQKESRSIPLRRNYSWLKIAAVLFVAAGTWGAYHLLSSPKYTTVMASSKVVVKSLPDGSELTLNKNSLISFANNFKDNRSIRMQKGEVFFRVTPNKEKPFIIDLDKISIKVVGTSFNVKHLNKQTEIIVETGIVKVSSGHSYIELRKGEKVLIRNGTSTLTREINTDQLYNYYRSKVFVTNNTPVWRIVEVLNEAYQANIVVENPQIGNLTLTTTFKEDTLDHILQVICESLNIYTIRKDGKILLSNHR